MRGLRRSLAFPTSDTGRDFEAGVVRADNLVLMREFPDASCDLIYVDPPFLLAPAVAKRASTVRASDPRIGAAGRPDSASLEAFVAFLRPRVVEMHRLLGRCGCLYVHLDWHTVHYVKVMLDGVFGADHFLNEIIWHYHSGGRLSQWFPRKHDTLLVYAKAPGEQTFNRLRGGAYRTQDLRYDDAGIPYKSTGKGRIYFHKDGPALSDVWDLPFLSTVSNEREGYPYQKPEALLERIVRASSNEGDMVADFFCGSGTTLAVAKRLARRWIGCDVSPEAIAITRRRLARLGEGRCDPAPAKVRTTRAKRDA